MSIISGNQIQPLVFGVSLDMIKVNLIKVLEVKLTGFYSSRINFYGQCSTSKMLCFGWL